MSVYFDKSKGRWRYSFNRVVGGTRSRATKLLPAGWSQRQAEAYDREKSGSLYARAAGIESERLPLAGAVELYVSKRCPNLKNGRKAIQDLAHLADYIKGAYLDQADTVATLYQNDMEGKLAPATIRNRLAYLRASVRYARKKHGYGRGQPDHGAGMSMPEVDNERQVYAKVPELNRLWNAFTEPEAAALFKLVFYVGLRWRQELLTRKPEHIERNRNDVWLDIGQTTKNGEPVMKFVHPEARKALDFIPFTMSDSWYYDRWHEAIAKIGRPDLKPHDLRHSLASEILSRTTGTLEQVQSALHQKSIASAQRYAHLYPSRMKAILAATGGARKSAHRRVKSAKQKPQKAA